MKLSFYTNTLFSVVLFFLVSCESTPENSNEMTPEKWKSDIEYLITTLESKHIHLYHSNARDSVQKQVDILQQKLQHLSDDEIYLQLAKIIKSLDDSHTGIWQQGDYYDAYPLEFFVFSEQEVRVTRTPKNHSELLGAKLLSIDGTPLTHIIKEVSSVAQCTDNWYSESERFASYLKYSKVLKGFGITKKEDAAIFEFQLEDSTKKKLSLNAVPNSEYLSTLTAPIQLNSPFKFENAVIGVPYLWYQPLEELHTAYIYFSGYPELLQMRRFAIALTRDIIKKDLRNVIIDLRDNGGGNFFIGIELIKSLSFINQIDWKDGVYVITHRTTYSAGMSNTAQCKELLNAKIVGEPTGSNPNDYQDAEGFPLPNSQLWVQFSKRHYQFQDSVSEGILPDVHIQPKWENWKNKVDADLTWILEDIRKNNKRKVD
ncbi:S41 family peptidase [Flammeovirga sp. SJP92]|uniref:S41 family peptidase n=1 Tax=Flammeovirga sp. SJP92 TaxID=1775430 RepID=UPI000787828C|nr:S41 family peptidase [Flammeovirga sp. SJP92]KXX66872.1 hypothetical protein AVL50_30540 [Flammeovirga sp. SJP92]